MEKLNKKRELSKTKERLQVDLFNRLEAEKQKAFEVALQGDELLKIQFLNDFDIIASQFKKWQDKTKSEDHKKTIRDLSVALIRINIYATNQHTLAKRATAESIVMGRQLSKGMLELAEMRKQMDELNKQLEFHEATK